MVPVTDSTQRPSMSGDVRVSYGDVYDVVKIAKDCNVRHLGLVSAEK